MMTTSAYRPSPEFETLLDLLCEEQLTPEQALQLEEAITSDEEACWHYLCYVHVHGMLAWNAGHSAKPRRPSQEREEDISSVEIPILPPMEGPSSTLGSLLTSVRFAYTVAAVSLTFALTVAWFALKPPAADDFWVTSTFLETAESVGQITGLADCQWEESATAASHGDAVALGRRYALRSGALEITYDRGAKVILQGPVVYDVASTNGGFLHQGKMTGKITTPRAKGFTVRTPTVAVVDLGTEFGVEVGKEGHTTSHVFQGSVKLLTMAQSGESTAFVLNKDEAARVERAPDRKKAVVIVPCGAAQAEQFIHDGQLDSFHRWEAYRQELRRDPSLLAYYDFQPRVDKPDVLPNVTANGEHSLDGRIEKAVWTSGRMPGKRALQFTGQGEHVDINLPQEVDSLTVAAWLYVESVDPQCEAAGLLMSCGWDKPGQLHWQLLPDGRMVAGVQGMPAEGRKRSDTVVSLLDRGGFHRWTHVATVHDQKAMTLTFYYDGQLVETVKLTSSGPTKICLGPASIGWWGGDAKRLENHAPRDFCGRIDEMAIFGRPLSGNEIRRMVEAGTP